MPDFQQVNDQAIMKEIVDGASASDIYVFDCDGTLINSDISVFTGWQLVHNGLANQELLPEPWVKGNKGLKIPFEEFEAMQDHVTNEKGVTAAYEWEIKLQSGLSPKMVTEIATTVRDKALAEGKLRYTKHVAKLAESVAPQAWVVSGSSHPTVSAIAEKLNIPPDRVLATSLDEVDGMLQSYFKDPGIIWEETKRTILKQNGVEEPYFVAGDTIGDWHMLQMSKKWRWCVLWDDYRHRGLEWRKFLQENVFLKNEIPSEPGFYRFDEGPHSWVIEVKADFT